jgi:hypothetical protein
MGGRGETGKLRHSWGFFPSYRTIGPPAVRPAARRPGAPAGSYREPLRPVLRRIANRDAPQAGQ